MFHCFLLVHRRLGQSAFLSSMYFHGPWLLWLFKSPEGSGFVIFCSKKLAYFGLKISETNPARLMCDMTFSDENKNIFFGVISIIRRTQPVGKPVGNLSKWSSSTAPILARFSLYKPIQERIEGKQKCRFIFSHVNLGNLHRTS